MMGTAVLARTDETARDEPDEAGKTVMGASGTGSDEVTDVPPVTCSGRGHPDQIDGTSARQRSVGQAESQTSRGAPPPTSSLSGVFAGGAPAEGPTAVPGRRPPGDAQPLSRRDGGTPGPEIGRAHV